MKKYLTLEIPENFEPTDEWIAILRVHANQIDGYNRLEYLARCLVHRHLIYLARQLYPPYPDINGYVDDAQPVRMIKRHPPVHYQYSAKKVVNLIVRDRDLARNEAKRLRKVQ